MATRKKAKAPARKKTAARKKDPKGSAATQFKPGQSGNPAGRPKGGRNRFNEAFVQAVADDFAEHGREVLEHVRMHDPATYLRTVTVIVDKHVVNRDGSLEELIAEFANMDPEEQAAELLELMEDLQASGQAAGLDALRRAFAGRTAGAGSKTRH